MKNNRFFLAVIVGTIVSFLLGWLIYGMLLKNFMVENSGLAKDIAPKVFKPMTGMPEVKDMLVMVASDLFGAILFTVIAGWAGAKSLMSGAKVGFIIGLLFALNIDLIFYAVSYMYTPLGLAVDIAAATVMITITTAVIGAILGTGKTSS